MLDVGCGDLLFWDGKNCSKYTGLDISPTILEINKKSHPDWNFLLASADESLDLHAETVLCLDMLFHIMDDNVYDRIIENLSRWTNRNLVIFTWITNPLKSKGIFGITKGKEIKTDGKYQTYRDFDKYERKLVNSGLRLLAKEPIPFNEYGALWFFQK